MDVRLLHPGDVGFLTSMSINTFIQTNFGMPAPSTNDVQEREALTEFVRKFDTGTAPAACPGASSRCSRSAAR